LTETLIKELKARIKRLVLVPSDGGRFEVSIDGALIFSKLKTGRFPEYQEIRKHIK
jgi:selenoprotein W-related protein